MRGKDNDPDRFRRTLERLAQAGNFTHGVLVEAARDGRIDLLVLYDRTAATSWGRIRASSKPVLMLVCDDDDLATGPVGWRCAAQLTRWAAGALVHGAGARREHYELAIGGAVACRRFLVVDCASRHAHSWAGLLRHAEVAMILPTGGEHPIVEPRGWLH